MFSGKFKRSPRLVEQWPAALRYVGSALRAGLTLEEALGSLARQAPEPLRTQLAHLDGDTMAWSPLAQRIDTALRDDNLALARAALLLAHRAGARSADLLDRAAAAQQANLDMQQRLLALTAQSRLSAGIVAGTPFGILVMFGVMAPDFVAPLFTSAIGLCSLSVAALLIGVGLLIVRRMVRVRC